VRRRARGLRDERSRHRLFDHFHLDFWAFVGFAGQALFTARFFVQWLAGEEESVMPVAFGTSACRRVDLAGLSSRHPARSRSASGGRRASSSTRNLQLIRRKASLREIPAD
jgi:hypothetical protein